MSEGRFDIRIPFVDHLGVELLEKAGEAAHLGAVQEAHEAVQQPTLATLGLLLGWLMRSPGLDRLGPLLGRAREGVAALRGKACAGCHSAGA